MSMVRFLGYEPRAERAAAVHKARERSQAMAPAIRKPSEPDPDTAMWFDRRLPASRFLLNRDLTEAESIAAAALDWDKADNAATARVRRAYQRRALRFEALARRLSWKGGDAR